MTSTKKEFALCETVASVLHAVCEAYGIDGCWLPWQYEKHVLIGGASPFKITTSEYPRNIKEGVDKVSIEVDFDKTNPNLIKFIRFDELPSKGKYLITQTSMKHVHEGEATCSLWIEIPKGGDREGISGIHALLKAEICCAEWKDYLGPSPETMMEKAHLVVAQDDVDWLKGQLISKDNTANRLTSSLAFSRIEVTALRTEIDRLNAEVAKNAMMREKIDELKAELKAASKANDTAVEQLEAQLKELNTNVEKLQGTLKTKTDTIAKLRRDLKAKADVAKDSDSESPTAAGGAKKRKMAALKTPKRSDQFNITTPNTAPVPYGHSSALYSVTPFHNAAFSQGNPTVAARTRGATMASSIMATPTIANDTPTAKPSGQAESVVSISSASGADGEVFN